MWYFIPFPSGNTGFVALSQSVVWSATNLHDGSLILGLILGTSCLRHRGNHSGLITFLNDWTRTHQSVKGQGSLLFEQLLKALSVWKEKGWCLYFKFSFDEEKIFFQCKTSKCLNLGQDFPVQSGRTGPLSVKCLHVVMRYSALWYFLMS